MFKAHKVTVKLYEQSMKYVNCKLHVAIDEAMYYTSLFSWNISTFQSKKLFRKIKRKKAMLQESI